MATKVRERPKAAEAYEGDFSVWLVEQANLIRSGRAAELDADNVAEELEGLARSEFRSLISALRIILLHMLKWDHQPERRSASWTSSIRDQRAEYDLVLEDNPSFRPRRGEALVKAYRRARLEAARETGLLLDAFPEACPYDLGEVLDRPFETDSVPPRP